MKTELATFAGGCFWCMEKAFRKLDGVVDVVPGYTGGKKEYPTYEEVCSGKTGHYEAIQVAFIPSKVSYEQLLETFWKNVDPTDSGGQFADRGNQYRTAIFYHNDEQKKSAENSIKNLDESKIYEKPIATAVIRFEKFYEAEDYHKNYSEKNPIHYKTYEEGSGRADYVRESIEAKLRKKLTPLQFEVTQKNGTEMAFDNEYWDNKRKGIYVNIVTGEPLFSSNDKFDSGTGWPSFTQPLEKDNIALKVDKPVGARTEVRSKQGDTHLGHLFDDGPKPIGKRFCMNSAALRFIPSKDLEKEGYGKYKKLFEKKK